MERILLAIDGSEHSRRAASLAGELSSCLRVPVFVLHVVPERVFASTRGLAEEYAQIERVDLSHQNLLDAAGHNVADDVAARVRHAEGNVNGEEVVIGDPAREIVAAADRLDTECIVMGRRGLGDVGGFSWEVSLTRSATSPTRHWSPHNERSSTAHALRCGPLERLVPPVACGPPHPLGSCQIAWIEE
jgi:nucleotide-binding universal stress UspA family protein